MLRALPQTDGTYAEVIKRARDYDAEVSKDLLGKWVSTGRRDLKAGKPATAFVRFDAHYDRLKTDHCTADANRQRESERALQILERTCECGNEKTTMPDGSVGDTCTECKEIEEKRRQQTNER